MFSTNMAQILMSMAHYPDTSRNVVRDAIKDRPVDSYVSLDSDDEEEEVTPDTVDLLDSDDEVEVLTVPLAVGGGKRNIKNLQAEYKFHLDKIQNATEADEEKKKQIKMIIPQLGTHDVNFKSFDDCYN
jgi:imidazole glycerol phosphate synthase subunit HisF